MIKINLFQILNSIKNKKKIIVPILVVLLIFSIYQAFFKKSKNGLNLAEVERGIITQEVSETGKVKRGEEINLNFKNSGEIEKIYVEVGNNVEAGQKLAELNTDQLYIQLKEADANLDIAEAKETVKQQELKDTITQTDESLKGVYEDALAVLGDSYLKIYNALNFINYLRDTYFNRSDVPSINVFEVKVKIERALNNVKTYLDVAEDSSKYEDIDLALSNIKEDLSETKTGLETTRSMIEEIPYKSLVSTTDKNTLDTHKLNINTVYSSIVSVQQSISTTKINNQAEIDAIQLEISNSENYSGVGLYQAQIDVAKAQVQLLEKQIEDATLKSPIAGQIIKINKREGELVQPTSQEALITVLPKASFELETNIYEEDVIKMEIGNPVKISLISIPDKVFKGKVAVIDPAEELIEGVVYYKLTIVFDEELPQNVKPGMTADVKIITSKKENVLIVPQEAIQKKDDKQFVQVYSECNSIYQFDNCYKNKKTEDREVVMGLEGSDGQVEIVSGLEEGEKVILK